MISIRNILIKIIRLYNSKIKKINMILLKTIIVIRNLNKKKE